MVLAYDQTGKEHDLNSSSNVTHIFILNTDAKSLGGNSPHNKWFMHKKAFSGGDYLKYGERIMGKLRPGDLLTMYANKIGAVGVGKVLSYWNKQQVTNNQIVYTTPYADIEYSIDVDWFADRRTNPIPAFKIIDSNGGCQLNRACIKVNDTNKFISMLATNGVRIP